MAIQTIEATHADAAVGLLVDAMDATDQAIRVEARRFELATEWAALHPGEEPDPEIDPEVDWAMRPLEVAGPGAPTVDESAVAELAIALGMTHDQGIGYLGDAVEIRHRLPHLWARVIAGEVLVSRARQVAQSTKSLPLEGAAFVDRSVAPVAARCSWAQIERTVEAARAEFDPAETERRRLEALEKRHVTLEWDTISSDGVVDLHAGLDLADALNLEDFLTATAATLDPAIPLDVRRSMALGMLARGETDKQLVIYTHARPDASMVEVENTRSVITPEQVREWCQTAGTKVTVRPVLDLTEELSTTGHDPTPTMREQAFNRFPTCVFLGCGRPSRGCDLDHRIPYDLGGLTTTSNLFPLCRTHHRLKTTGGWTYQPLDARTIEWTSPLGFTYQRHIH